MDGKGNQHGSLLIASSCQLPIAGSKWKKKHGIVWSIEADGHMWAKPLRKKLVLANQYNFSQFFVILSTFSTGTFRCLNSHSPKEFTISIDLSHSDPPGSWRGGVYVTDRHCSRGRLEPIKALLVSGAVKSVYDKAYRLPCKSAEVEACWALGAVEPIAFGCRSRG